MNNEAATQAMANAMVEFGRATPEQASQWVAADKAALNGGTPSAAPAGTTPSGGVDVVARAAELVRTGQMTQAQADAALSQYNAAEVAGGGAPLSAKPAVALPLAPSGAPSPFEGVQLEEGFRPPENATAYQLNALVSENLSIDQLRNIGETLKAAQLPKPIGEQLVSEIARVSALGDVDMKVQRQNTASQLNSLWGANAEANVETALKFIDAMEVTRPGLWKLMERSGAIYSSTVIRTLFLQAQRLNSAPRK